MKHTLHSLLLALLMSIFGIEASAHDIEVANSDGVTIYYIFTNNNTELMVSYRGTGMNNYSYEYSGNVTIPESVTYNETTYPVTSIGYGAFSGCSLTSVTIPNSVTSIGEFAFFYCIGLKNLTIGNSVTNIERFAFKSCFSLWDVYCYAMTVQDKHNEALENFYYATLHVPSPSLEVYKESTSWNRFENIVALTDNETTINDIDLWHSITKDYYSLDGMKSKSARKGFNPTLTLWT